MADLYVVEIRHGNRKMTIRNIPLSRSKAMIYLKDAGLTDEEVYETLEKIERGEMEFPLEQVLITAKARKPE